ncbi:TRI27 protein, partial [Chordeiles acutipennis]|nr:TRI27 protein [Chordeiles acutipennis]
QGCDPTVCRGGTARSWPERGRPGDAEVVTHRSWLRKGHFQPKEHLEHLVEKLKLLGLDGGKEEKEHLCSWHKRMVTFKGGARTSSCDGPRARGGPAIARIEESTQEDREQIRGDLEKLKKHKEEILELRRSGERRCQEYLTRTEAQRQKIVSEFRQLRRFLKEQELVLLAQLGELDREMMKRQEEEETKMSGEISLLDVLICKMEKKLEEPASGFLQEQFASRWDMGSAWRTTKTFSDLEQRLRVVSRQNSILRETLRRFQAFVTLDPATANAQLILSRDRRGARWTDGEQDLPATPQRFDVSCCVMGYQGFTMGRHWWEVEVAKSRAWALGVARRSVSRRGWVEFQPEKGIWAVGRCGNWYRAFSSPITTFSTTGETGRVRVALDYGGGQVAFYFSKHEPPVFTFQNASFGGETIFPFFWV